MAGPFIVKSSYYARTPLFPFAVGLFPVNSSIDMGSPLWQSLAAHAQQAVETKDHYGQGRSFLDFLKHLWLIAVPEKGVNNRYDYPVGLMYLLCLGPFISIFFSSLKQKRFSILPWFLIAYWFSWWLGSHQSRFLFVPIVLMITLVFSRKQFLSKTFQLCILISVILVGVSIVRAHKADWAKQWKDILRSRDRDLLELSLTAKEGQSIQLDCFDVAFAGFPVEVVNCDSVFVLQYK